jgi:hypothetical protein
MPWPLGPFQDWHLHFSHFVSLGCELFTTIGKFSIEVAASNVAFFSRNRLLAHGVRFRNLRYLFS